MTLDYSNNINYAYNSAINMPANRYYKGKDGLKVAAIPAGIATISGIGTGITYGIAKKKLQAGEKLAPETMELYADTVKRGGIKGLILWSAIAIGGHLLCGAVVDAVRNKKSREFADKLELTGEYDRDRAGISQNNAIYYKSNIGAKVGAALGAVWSGGLLLAGRYIDRVKMPENNWYTKCITLAVGILGGAIMGKLSDHYANKNAEKTV